MMVKLDLKNFNNNCALCIMHCELIHTISMNINQSGNKKNKVQPLDIAWDMFKETGEIGYYMLYSKLRNDEDTLE